VINLSGTCDAPLLGVAYCRLLFNVSQRTQPSLSTSANVSAAGTLTMLIKDAINGHILYRRTL